MTRAKGLTELCEEFLAADMRVGYALIAGRPEAIKLLAAASVSPLPPWKRPDGRIPADERERWIWLWCGYEGGPDEPEFLRSLARVASLSVETAYRVWPPLMASRVLMPDGTLTSVGLEILERLVGKSVEPQKRGPGRPRKDESAPLGAGKDK